MEPSEDLYNSGLKWACEPVVSQVPLLEKVSVAAEQGYVAFDYLVAILDGQHKNLRRAVLPDIWDFVIEHLSEEEAIPAGDTAILRNDLAMAERIWRTVARGSSPRSAEAAFKLGALLRDQGDIAGARAAYQQAIDSDHPDVAPKAAYDLGSLLRKQGDKEGARAARQRAMYNLESELHERGDIEGAGTTFISHSSSDRDAAERLVELLRAKGFDALSFDLDPE